MWEDWGRDHRAEIWLALFLSHILEHTVAGWTFMNSSDIS